MPSALYQAPRGTQDVLPEEAPYWTYVEAEARRQALLANFGEIRTPTFEATPVFARGVGATTDIVEKQMFTFEKGQESLTLRPEGTAAVVRAYMEHGMASRPQPVKLFSLIAAFRAERPQRGRYREFHQFNAEAIGEEDALADAELVALQWRLYQTVGLRGLTLLVNSIGDPVCRPGYLQALREYFEAHHAELCEDCRRRLPVNPLRLLDDKNPACQPVLDAAPASADHLCGPCKAHFDAWLGYLAAAGIPFEVTPRLVRGLDYYTRSVWEVVPAGAGAQGTLGGGGRYDGLAEQLGGRHTPGVGFATGIERIILEMKEQQVRVPDAEPPRVFFVYQSDPAKQRAFQLAEGLRAQGISVDLSFGDRKLGKQLDRANRSGADLALILGEEEVARGAVRLKELRDGAEQRTIPEAELLAEILGDRKHA